MTKEYNGPYKDDKVLKKLRKELNEIAKLQEGMRHDYNEINKAISSREVELAIAAYGERVPKVGTTVIARRPELKKGFKVFIRRIYVDGYNGHKVYVEVNIIKSDGQSGKDDRLLIDNFIFEPIQ